MPPDNEAARHDNRRVAAFADLNRYRRRAASGGDDEGIADERGERKVAVRRSGPSGAAHHVLADLERVARGRCEAFDQPVDLRDDVVNRGLLVLAHRCGRGEGLAVDDDERLARQVVVALRLVDFGERAFGQHDLGERSAVAIQHGAQHDARLAARERRGDIDAHLTPRIGRQALQPIQHDAVGAEQKVDAVLHQIYV